MNRRNPFKRRERESTDSDDYIEEVQRRDMPHKKWGYNEDWSADRALLYSGKRDKVEPYKPHPLIVPNKLQNYIGAVLQALSAIPSIQEIYATRPAQYVENQSLSDHMTTYFMMQRHFDHGVPVPIDGPVHALVRKNTVWGANKMQDAGELLKELLAILIEEVHVGKHIPSQGTTNQLRRRFSRFGGTLRRKVTNLTQNSMDMVRKNSRPEVVGPFDERPWDGPTGLRLRRTQLPISDDEQEEVRAQQSLPVPLPSRGGTGHGSSRGLRLTENNGEASRANLDFSIGSFASRGREAGSISGQHVDRYAEAWEAAGGKLAEKGGIIGAFTHLIQGSTVEAFTSNVTQHRRSGGEIPFTVLDIPPYVLTNGTLGSVKDSLKSYAALKGYDGGPGREALNVRMEIEIQPRILFLKIDRFTLSRRAVHQYDKIPHHVEFENTLDISPYVYQGGLKPGEQLEYELCAVIEHVGPKLNNGSHYKTYCKAYTGKDKMPEWYECRDGNVRLVAAAQAFSAQAYILVYEKTGFEWGEFLRNKIDRETSRKSAARRNLLRSKSPGPGPSMAGIRRTRSPVPGPSSNPTPLPAQLSSDRPGNLEPLRPRQSAAGPSNFAPIRTRPSAGPSNLAPLRTQVSVDRRNNLAPLGTRPSGAAPSNPVPVPMRPRPSGAGTSNAQGIGPRAINIIPDRQASGGSRPGAFPSRNSRQRNSRNPRN